MKIRQGFVSNSSSSSFCIYGIFEEESDIIDALIEKEVLSKELVDEKEKEDYFCLCEFLEILLENDNFVVVSDEENIAIGKSMGSIPDNVIVGEWKKEIEEKLNSILGKKFEINVYQHAYFC